MFSLCKYNIFKTYANKYFTLLRHGHYLPLSRLPSSAPASTLQIDIELATKNEESKDIASSVLHVPGDLPKSADNISKPARALLLRLLEKNPQYRIRSLRQMQQSAFYMGYNFDEVKARKISPKSMLGQYECEIKDDLCKLASGLTIREDFKCFDQDLNNT